MADEVCLATNIKNKDDQMDLNVKDGKVSMNTTSATVSPKDDAYVYAGFTNQTIYSCELNGTSSNNDNGTKASTITFKITELLNSEFWLLCFSKF